MLGLAMRYRIAPSLCFLLVTYFTPADGQIIGKDICACSPSSYEFTFAFDLSCPPMNITKSDAIDQTSCVITSFGAPNVTDLVPVSVQSIDVLELGQGLRVLVQENIIGNFSNGDSFVYTSLTAAPIEINETDEVPRAIQINIVGTNNLNEALINVYIITFTNDCGAFPLFLEGQSAGWTYFTRLDPPGDDVCPLGNVDIPTGAPSLGIVSADPTQSETLAPTTLTPPDTNDTAAPSPTNTHDTSFPTTLVPPSPMEANTFLPLSPSPMGDTVVPTQAAPVATNMPVTTSTPSTPSLRPTTSPSTMYPMKFDPPTAMSMSLSTVLFAGIPHGNLLEEFGLVESKVCDSIDCRCMWVGCDS